MRAPVSQTAGLVLVLLAGCAAGRGRPCGPCGPRDPCPPPPCAALPAPAASPSPSPASSPAPPAVPAAPPDADAGRLPREVWDVAAPRAWRVIVVHHSAGHAGGAARIDEMHKARGWDGVGYDFVVGNGTETADGALETTFRWREQRDGAHAKGWNDLAIGVCLVGDFEQADPTPRQRETLVLLLRHLRRRFGIPRERVIGHGAVGATLCPGKRLPLRDIAAEADPEPAPSPAAGRPAGDAP